MSNSSGIKDMKAWLEGERSGLSLALNTARGGFRIAETLGVVGRQGLGWLLGNRPPVPALLRTTFESLGTTYIKLGQFIASSPSIFPEEYVEEFQRCLDRTPPLPFHYIRQTIEKELGQPLEDLYLSVDPKPLASASIAQVHSAKLKNGKDVVIKVD